jgi:hypothetical protein
MGRPSFAFVAFLRGSALDLEETLQRFEPGKGIDFNA